MEYALAAASFSATDGRRRAVRTVTLALGLGTLTQALFWRTGLGVNFFLWNLLILACELALFSRRPRSAPPTAWGAIACSLLLSFSVVLYASDWTLAIAVPADLAVLVALPFLLRDEPTIAGLAAVPAQALRSFGRTPRAAREAVGVSREALGGRSLAGAGMGLLLGLPAAGLFTVLLSADEDFQRAIRGVCDRCGEGLLFAGWSLVSASAFLLASGLPARRPRGAEGVFAPGPYRGGEDRPLAGGPGAEARLLAARPATAARVTPVAWAMVIGQVATVFGLFVAANLRHLFGGRALVRASGATTYASYLHAGFAQLLVATGLSVCLVLGGHRLLRPRDEAGRLGPVEGGRTLVVLEGTLLALTGVTVASCAQRLAIYEEAYGATRERLGVALVALAILGLLALTFVKVVRRGWRGHGGATLTFLAALAVFASGINADAYVAATNLDRAARGRSLDVDYLSTLSRDAASMLRHPVVLADPALARVLERTLCREGDSGWRARRGMGRCEPVREAGWSRARGITAAL